MYVYPGQWANDKDGKVRLFKISHGINTKSDHFFEPIWMTKGSATDVQIYLNPGLIDLIKNSFFSSPTAFGYKYKDRYVSSHPNPDRNEPELTISIVALGATAVQNFFPSFELLLMIMVLVLCCDMGMAYRKEGEIKLRE